MDMAVPREAMTEDGLGRRRRGHTVGERPVLQLAQPALGRGESPGLRRPPIHARRMARRPARAQDDLVEMPPGEFHWFAMFVVFAALWLMHAIATSDSAP